MYRNKKILKAARGEECCLQAGDCNGNPETTVAAHLPKRIAGGGMGVKCDDFSIVFCCSNCHDVLDMRKTNYNVSDEMLHRAHIRTLRRLFEEEIIK